MDHLGPKFSGFTAAKTRVGFQSIWHRGEGVHVVGFSHLGFGSGCLSPGAPAVGGGLAVPSGEGLSGSPTSPLPHAKAAPSASFSVSLRLPVALPLVRGVRNEAISPHFPPKKRGFCFSIGHRGDLRESGFGFN